MPIQIDEVLLNKAAVIERCIARIREEYILCPELDNFTHVDAMTLNIERACQATIDMATHLAAIKHLGIPQSSANAFELLYHASIIDEKLMRSMKAIAGFRNVAVHEYQELNLDILKFVAEQGFNDFIVYCKQLGITIHHPDDSLKS
jgi:uncharacterized protein YutE (UPF0331/DUF86 family)